MGKLLLRWIILALAIVIAGQIAKAVGLAFTVETKEAGDWIKVMLGAAVLGFLNATLGPILKLLTLPLNCLTFGLFSLVINAVVLMIASQTHLGFSVKGFWPAFFASILIAIIAGILGIFVPDDDKKK
jgi:putative membrane protein